MKAKKIKTHKKFIMAISILVVLGVVGTAMAVYTAWTEITSVSITSHSDGDVVFASHDYTVTCTTSTDTDCHDEGGWHLESDPVTHTWTGDGTFAAPGTGTSLTWTAPASTGSATITVTADDSPKYDETAKQDSVTLTVLKVNSVEIHTTSSYNDNGGSGLNDCQVHFGHKDGTGDYAYPDVYIEISMDGGDSGQVDQFTILVTSESDSTGINVDFTETGANTNIYRCDDPIHLSTASSQGNLEIKVLDEEKLHVGCCDSVEVDRGEVSTITCELDHLQALGDAGADAIDYFFDKDEGSDPDPYYWWDGGEKRDEINTFATFIKNVGDVSLSFPTDFIFECSHGDLGNIGIWWNGSSWITELYKPTGGTPTVTSTDWEKDIEWAIFYSCHVLGQYRNTSPSEWVDEWDNALIRQSGENCAHGILASCDVLYAFPTEEHMELFCDYMKGGVDKIKDAYMKSALDIEYFLKQWNASALMHAYNMDDRLGNMTQDTTNTQMYYTYYATFEEEPNWPDPNEVDHWSGSGSGTGGYEVLCDIPTDQPNLTKMLVRKEVLNKNALDDTGFGVVKFDNTGRVRFRKTSLEETSISLTKAQATAMATDFIAQKGGGMPADADLTAVRGQLVVTYDALDPVNTRNAYIKKAFFEYGHEIDGIEVVGDNCGDSIFISIEGDQVVGLNRHWRNIVGPTGSAQQVISAGDALDIAVENIPRVIIIPPDGSYGITEIKLFYYGTPSEAKDRSLIPAWGFQINASLWVYVDAFTGKFLL